MARALLFIVLGLLVNAIVVRCICRTTVVKRDKSIILRCVELKDLSRLERANSKAATIEITDSNITNLPGHQFAKFGATLITLDLHESKIETIDPNAFIALTKLENLYLWGNKLKMVTNNWFQDTQNLKTLDVSFNNIEVIDYMVFQRLPNLENFYFDYNQIKFIDYAWFGYLKNLKNVKFEKNPLHWGFRAHLTWQLDNQHVKHSKVWEDWAWMNAMIKECTDSGYGEIPQEKVLDCVAVKLIDFAHEILVPERKRKDRCDIEAKKMVSCMRPQNVTGNNDDETMKKILEAYIAILHPLINPQGCKCRSVVTICRLEGPPLQIRIHYSETVGFLKKLLAELLQDKHRNWKPEKMRLWFRGFYLENNYTLSDYNLTSEDRIMLLLDDRCSF